MTPFRIMILWAMLCPISLAASSKGKLVAGPMQGATTPTGMKIWLMVKNADSVTFSLLDSVTSLKVASQTLAAKGVENFKGNVPLTFTFNGLKENTAYQYEISLDGEIIPGSRTLKTSESNPDTFSFLLFSCALTPPFGLRWLHPGIENRTYKYIAEKESDFTVWMGDYLYYLRKDFSSKKGMLRKQTRNRKLKKVHRFLLTQPQYSIWDDHDFGPNNKGSSFALRDESLEVFKQFWPNPYYGADNAKGVFFDFTYGDTQFFLLDNRYHMTPPTTPDAAYIGKEQLEWLKQKLLESKAAFKFIVSGSQVLNVVTKHECFCKYKNEFNELLGFIDENNISGVLFFSGDRHHSDLIKMERANNYTLYDFTSSPVTSFRNRLKHSPEELHNQNRVPGKLVPYQNFGRVTISGNGAQKVCTLEVFDKRGKPVWSYEVKSSELTRNGLPEKGQ